MDLNSQLDDCESLPDVFEVVKRVVKDTLGQRRAGLMLGFGDLPIAIAAFHVMGSNIIVINENVYDRVLREKPDAIYTWSFRVLLHEYLHSLGVRSESEVRRLVRDICRGLSKSWNPEVEFMRERLHFFPTRRRHSQQSMKNLSEVEIKLVEGFDQSNTRYIS